MGKGLCGSLHVARSVAGGQPAGVPCAQQKITCSPDSIRAATVRLTSCCPPAQAGERAAAEPRDAAGVCRSVASVLCVTRAGQLASDWLHAWPALGQRLTPVAFRPWLLNSR